MGRHRLRFRSAACLGLVALAARQELLLIVLGGVFVAVEAAQRGIAQVGWFRSHRPTHLLVRAAASPFSIARLERAQNRRPLLAGGHAMRRLRPERGWQDRNANEAAWQEGSEILAASPLKDSAS